MTPASPSARPGERGGARRVLALLLALGVSGCDGDGTIQHNADGSETGLILYTDALTGCQYVRASYRDGLAPRMGRDGKQICG